MILDCTLRDGGYYNDWDFDKELVQQYLHRCKEAGINVVELGFRNFSQNKFLGAYAYTTDEYIKQLDIPKGLDLAVMIDAKSLTNDKANLESNIDRLFTPRKDSIISIVRIAAHFNEALECQAITKHLKSLGYVVGFNLMQAGGRSAEDFSSIVTAISSWGTVDVLYFADSLGNMCVKEVTRITHEIQKNWKGAIGIHTHDNKGKALENSMAAIDLGIKWIDSTMLGMGRGAGNAKTELLLLELAENQHDKYEPQNLNTLILDKFTPLKKKYEWGPNILYHIAANKNIHPTYIQEMLADKRYSSNDILAMIDYLGQHSANSFDKKLLEGSNRDRKDQAGSWNASGWCKNKEILIIANGPSLTKYKGDIVDFIERKRPTVISLNVTKDIPEEYIDLYAASHTDRIRIEANSYKQLKKPIALPLKDVAENIADSQMGSKVQNYGLTVKKNTFEAKENHCILPSQLAIGYALSLAKAGNCKSIYLAGFDGYKDNQDRHSEADKHFILFQKAYPEITVTALTKTTYSVQKSSIYAPR